MSARQYISTFNGGELSPLLDGRTDIDKYRMGCQILENFIPLPAGGVMRRPGTIFIGNGVYDSKRVRLLPFIFSETTRYVMEFGNLYVRFWDADSLSIVQYVPSRDWEPLTAYVGTELLKGPDGKTYVVVNDEYLSTASFETDLANGELEEVGDQNLITPYLESDLRGIQFAQINDICYFVHPSYPPYRLRRLLIAGNVQFRFEEMVPDWPALLDENISATTMMPSATTGTITLACSNSSFFKTTHIGAYFQIGYARSSSTIAKTFAANGSSSSVKVFGSWSLNTYGTWSGTLEVERSYDGGGTWYAIRSYTASSDRNISTAGNELTECLLRLTFSNRTAGTATDRALLQIDSPFDYGLVQITGVGATAGWVNAITVTNQGSGYGSVPTVSITGGGGTGATAIANVSYVSAGFGGRSGYIVRSITITNAGLGYTSTPTVTLTASALGVTATATASIASTNAAATAEVINDLASTAATTLWSEGAWSYYQGFPRAIAVHENRIVYGGTLLKPQSVWGSRIDDFQNFRVGVLADDGFFFTIASRTTNQIQWMASKDGALNIGKLDAEGQLSSGSADSVISATNVQWVDTTKFGSVSFPAIELNDSLLFLQRLGRKPREFAFDNDRQAYVAPDISILSEHATYGGIVEWTSQQQQESIIWMIRADGQLIGMTYERDQAVNAWHRHTTQGSFESVCTLPGYFGDEIWVSVSRTINGTTKRFIEQFKTDWRDIFDAAQKSNWVYLDCAKTVTNDPSSVSVSGLDHLEGELVGTLTDGADGGEFTVDDGEITLGTDSEVVTVGLPYVSTLLPMKFDIPLRDGTSQGRKGRVTWVKLRILKSLGGKYSTDGTEYFDIPMRSADDNMDDSPPVQTGDTDELVDPGNWQQNTQVWIRQNNPMPLTILAMIINWSPSQD